LFLADSGGFLHQIWRICKKNHLATLSPTQTREDQEIVAKSTSLEILAFLFSIGTRSDMDPEGLSSTSGASRRRATRERAARGWPVGGEDNRDNSSDMSFIKLFVLIPDRCVGGVMGKGGHTISEMERSTPGLRKLKMSKETSMGTTERICKVIGDAEAVAVVLAFIADKIREEMGPNRPRAKQVRIEMR
jgi:hypothetical protein